MDKSTALTEGITIGRNLLDPMSSKPIKPSEGSAKHSSPYSTGKLQSSSAKVTKRQAWVESEKSSSDMQSFIFNEDMRRIRRAEAIILKAEEQFGQFSRDPDGRLVPLTQALTRKAAVELKKDDHRPLSEPSQTTFTYAPHALQGGIGMAETGWAPPILSAQQQLEALNERKPSKYVREVDDTVNPKLRGQAKSGGELQPAESRGTTTRPHKPIKASISSKVDFNRFRQIQTLGDRLEEVSRLKQELEAARRRAGSDSMETATQAIRSALTNQGGIGGMSPSAKPKTLSLDTKDFPDGFLANLDPNAKPLKKLDFSKVLGEPGQEVQLHDRSASSAPPSREGGSRKLPGRPSSKQGSRPSSSSSEFPTAEITIDKPPFDESVLKQAVIEETAVRRKLTKLTEEEKITNSLKRHEVDQKAQQRARDIERKRRLLSEADGRSVAIPLEDEPNVYDFYATKLQSTVRGWLVRRWVAWYREVSAKAAIVAQSLIRGWLGRLRVRKIRRDFQAATIIQKNFRGWMSRVSPRYLSLT